MAMETFRQGHVVVGAHPTLAGYQAVRYAVNEARRRGLPLYAVRSYRGSGAGLGAQWHDVLAEAAKAVIEGVFCDALGGIPRDLDVHYVVQEGVPARVLADLATAPSDVIVIGGSGGHHGGAPWNGSVARQLACRAICPVIVVPPPLLVRTGSTSRMVRSVAADASNLLDSAV
jgi:nucleotide-binding universal stress UspA family protein